MFILQADYNKYGPEELSFMAKQIRAIIPDEQILIMPTDINFIQNITDEQIIYMKHLLEKELEERHKNDL